MTQIVLGRTRIVVAALALVTLAGCTVGSNLTANGDFRAGTRDWVGVQAQISPVMSSIGPAAQVRPYGGTTYAIAQDPLSLTLPRAQAGHIYVAEADVMTSAPLSVTTVSVDGSLSGSCQSHGSPWSSPSGWVHISVVCSSFRDGETLDVSVGSKIIGTPGGGIMFDVTNITLRELTP